MTQSPTVCGEWQALAPGCAKCDQVTGNATCFPGPCAFFADRSQPGTKSYNIAYLDRVRRGMLEPVHTSTPKASS